MTDSASSRPISPSESHFSISTSMESRKFRDESGRMYQATNGKSRTELEHEADRADEYSLPADDAEVEHQAFHFIQGNKNYLAPMDTVLKGVDGETKRAIDIGCGSGIWTFEMAQEFPHVQFIGNDLVPVQYQEELPENLQFVLEDVNQGLPYPDGHFDVLHSRLMLAGIRDWKAYINECVRLVKSGGLVVFVEMSDCFKLVEDLRKEEQDKIAPAYAKWCRLVEEAMAIRKMDVRPAAKTIPDLLKSDQAMGEVTVLPKPLPFTPWSEDPVLRKAGELMLPDTKAVPSTLQLLITDACEITDAEYVKLAEDLLKEFVNKEVHPIAPLSHVWAMKL